MNLNVEVAYMVVIVNNFVKVLDHLKFPHQNSVILTFIFTKMVKNFSSFVIWELSQNIYSILFWTFIFQNVGEFNITIVFV